MRSPQYSDYLLGHGCVGAWIGNQLCGTAGWGPGTNIGVGAKLAGVCVDPLFSRLGIGRRLVEAAETRARRAGFSTVTSRTTANAVPFFAALGYTTSSQGAWMTPSGVSVPVVHMRKGPERDVQKAPAHELPPWLQSSYLNWSRGCIEPPCPVAAGSPVSLLHLRQSGLRAYS